MPSDPLMGFISPQEFSLEKLAKKIPIPSSMRTADWQALPQLIRDQSQWSAGVTNARFVQTFQDALLDNLKRVTEKKADGTYGLKIGGRGDFVREMMDFAKREGMPHASGPDASIMELTGSNRLKLIFDVNMQSAESFGAWAQGNDPQILDVYPAQRFIRVVEVKEPREIHAQNEGVVRLKSDVEFWRSMNTIEDGGFGVPWGPWGFGSGMDVEDVTYGEAVELGLLAEGEAVESPAVAYQQSMEADMGSMDPALKEKLLGEFGGQVKADGDNLTFGGNKI